MTTTTNLALAAALLSAIACSNNSKLEPQPIKTSLITTTPLGEQVVVDLNISELSVETLIADAFSYGETYSVRIDVIEPYVEDIFKLSHTASGDSLTLHEWDEGQAFKVVLAVDGREYILNSAEEAAAFDPSVSESGSKLMSLLGLLPALRQAMFGAPLDSEEVALAAASCACEQALAIDPLTWLVVGTCAAVAAGYCSACSGSENKCGAADCVDGTFYSCPCLVSDVCDRCIGTCLSECAGPGGALGPC